MRLIFFLWILLVVESGFAQSPAVEMRGVWIATVANIDWPSSKTLKTKDQKKEITEILDFYSKLNFNTIYLQVRPSADVFFKSKLEPWSYYLTGIQGKKPGYDPLKFWIEEAHKRGINIQAWINPYRITNSKNEKLSKNHPAMMHKDWVVEYGGKMYYNPGLSECKNHIKIMIKEIVQKYDVDGIHMDDYFYPYPVAGQAFPDSMTFENDKKGFENIDDWRRFNVNETIREISLLIKDLKPYVEFGVSPFGVWRNNNDDAKGSNTRAGVTNYDHLYADVLHWMKKGWVDYVTPQLYWRRSHPSVSFDTLTTWWSNNSYGKKVYIGHAVYKLNSGNEDWSSANEIIEQIDIVRKDSIAAGSVFFSHNHLKNNRLGIADSLWQKTYKYPALAPNVNADNSVQICPPCNIKTDEKSLKWKYDKLKCGQKPQRYAVYLILKGGVRQLVYTCSKPKLMKEDFPDVGEGVFGVQITSLFRNQESFGSEIVPIKSWKN